MKTLMRLSFYMAYFGVYTYVLRISLSSYWRFRTFFKIWLGLMCSYNPFLQIFTFTTNICPKLSKLPWPKYTDFTASLLVRERLSKFWLRSLIILCYYGMKKLSAVSILMYLKHHTASMEHGCRFTRYKNDISI